MRKTILFLIIITFSTVAFGQSRSVEEFREKHSPSLKLFFYKSTLKMFANLQMKMGDKMDDLEAMPELSSIIKNIEKVKFFSFNERDYNPQDELFSQLEKDIVTEGYESMMTARMGGADMNFLMKGDAERPDGFVVLMRSEEGVNIVDIEGYPDLKQIMKFSEFMNKNTSGLNSLADAFR